MNIQIETMVVLDNVNHVPTHKLVQYTVPGTKVYPLMVPIPVIKKGTGCIGLGMVSAVSMTVDSTTIEFTLTAISTENAKSYYNLYRNVISNSDSDAAYGDEDMVIPGLARSASGSMSDDDDEGDYSSNRFEASYARDRRRPKPKRGWD